MYIKSLEIPSILPDSDFRYFTLLEGIINSVDSKSGIEVIRKPKSYAIRVSPSLEEDKGLNLIVSEILKFHTLLGIHINLSKSIKTSGKIFYEISFEE